MLPLLLVLLAADPKPEPTPTFAHKLRKADDAFEASTKAGVVWTITSKSGIGGAEVELDKGDAPAKITIRLAGLKNLESFTLRDGLIRLSTRLGEGGTKRVLHFDDKGKLTVDEKARIGSLIVERTKDGVDVVLTSKKPGKKWSFRWVNEFRR